MEEPKNENEKDIINDKEKKEPHSFQIISKMEFENKIIKINELSNKRFGILLNDSLLIYNLNNFKKLYEIELPIKKNYDDGIFDFIELKNCDLVLWSLNKVFFYQLSENEYKLYQNVDGESEKEEEKVNDELISYMTKRNKEFNINSIYELSNDKLVCCNSLGLLIYEKKDDKYIYESKHKMDIDVRKIIEINPNKIILLQRYYYYYWLCSRSNFSSHTYSISVYEIDTKNLTVLAKNEVNQNNYYGYALISYLIKNGYLLIRYGNRINIYDINKNMALVNIDQDTMIKQFEIFKILKDEMDIIFLCDYKDNLIITKDTKNKAKIYMLKDNSLQYEKNFPFELEGLIEIIKLKNNTFIMYSKDQMLLLNSI